MRHCLSQDEICINPAWNFEGAIPSRLTLCLKQLKTHAAAPVEGVKEYTALKCIRPRLSSEKGRQTNKALNLSSIKEKNSLASLEATIVSKLFSVQ